MRTLFLTGYDDAFRSLGNLTSAIMWDYAEMHNFDFQRMRSAPEDCPESFHPSWWKMYRLLSAFAEGYERVIWMDADMIITNPDIVPPGEHGYHCSRDWGVDAAEKWQLSNCCFSVTPASADLIRWVLENRDSYSTLFHEQIHLCELARQGMFSGVLEIHPRRIFNAVPIEVHPSAPEPWQKGDWAAHLTMIPLKDRVALFHKIRRRISA